MLNDNMLHVNYTLPGARGRPPRRAVAQPPELLPSIIYFQPPNFKQHLFNVTDSGDELLDDLPGRARGVGDGAAGDGCTVAPFSRWSIAGSDRTGLTSRRWMAS